VQATIIFSFNNNNNNNNLQAEKKEVIRCHLNAVVDPMIFISAERRLQIRGAATENAVPDLSFCPPDDKVDVTRRS